MKKLAFKKIYLFFLLTFLFLTCNYDQYSFNEDDSFLGTTKQETLTTVTSSEIMDALERAENWIGDQENHRYIIKIPNGTHYLENEYPDLEGIIDIQGVKLGEGSKIVIEGNGPENTSLVINDFNATGFMIEESEGITIKDITFDRSRPSVSQGLFKRYYRENKVNYVELEIEEGFVTPDKILPDENSSIDSASHRRYLKRYFREGDYGDPQASENETQFNWLKTEQVSGRVWKFTLKGRTSLLESGYFTEGDLLAIKSKSVGLPYKADYSTRLEFINIHFKKATKGLIRTSHDVLVENCKLVRDYYGGKIASIAGPGGGISINSVGKKGGPSTNIKLYGNDFSHSGDDGVGLGNVVGVELKNNIMRNNFARGLVLLSVEDACFENNIVVNNPIKNESEAIYPTSCSN